MNKQTFISTTGSSIARAECTDGDWQITTLLANARVTCLVNDPVDGDSLYAGTHERGVLKSTDRGMTWQQFGLEGQVVKSLAVCRADPKVIYAGTKPPAIFASRDGGQTWAEMESFRKLRRWFWFTPAEPGDPYVMGLAVSPVDPDRVIAGVEFGGMFRSDDGGRTWQGHLKGTTRDCHNLRFHHTDGNCIYQAGGGWPAAVSSDGGIHWTQPIRGLSWSLYGMAVAADPSDPETWYVSAAPHAIFPQLHKMPRGHFDSEANAFIFRKRGSNRWERLGGGLPQPLPHMAYALVTVPDTPGHLYAGLSNGDIWHTSDYGDHWHQIPVNLGRIQYSMIVL